MDLLTRETVCAHRDSERKWPFQVKHCMSGVEHPASPVRELSPSSMFTEENLWPVSREAPIYCAAVFLTFMNFGK